MQDLYPLIREIPDFPKPGILFRDITPLLASPPTSPRPSPRSRLPSRGSR